MLETISGLSEAGYCRLWLWLNKILAKKTIRSFDNWKYIFVIKHILNPKLWLTLLVLLLLLLSHYVLPIVQARLCIHWPKYNEFTYQFWNQYDLIFTIIMFKYHLKICKGVSNQYGYFLMLLTFNTLDSTHIITILLSNINNPKLKIILQAILEPTGT